AIVRQSRYSFSLRYRRSRHFGGNTSASRTRAQRLSPARTVCLLISCPLQRGRGWPLENGFDAILLERDAHRHSYVFMSPVRRSGWSFTPLDILLVAMPVAVAMRYVPGWNNGAALFVVAALAIVPLAGWMGRATEQL